MSSWLSSSQRVGRAYTVEDEETGAFYDIHVREHDLGLYAEAKLNLDRTVDRRPYLFLADMPETLDGLLVENQIWLDEDQYLHVSSDPPEPPETPEDFQAYYRFVKRHAETPNDYVL